MKVSLSWLGDYVSFEMDVAGLVESLTMLGLEVETVDDRYAYLEKVVVGRITEVAPHPDADHLRVCRVDAGGPPLSIVCGAPNAAEGAVVPVALPGAELPDGTEIGKSVIRGVASNGMICSEAELGIGTDKSGIMILDKPATLGENLAKTLGLSDMVLDVAITPNRPDCLSVLGIAREVAAVCGTTLKYPEAGSVNTGGEISRLTSVAIENPDHCPRYTAMLISDVDIAPSPFWLQDRLMSVGLRPINNIVDITNFVMLETGQPLHAFDFDLLAEKRIVVRTAKDGEKFTTLDDKERILTSETLMICDGEKPVGVGGVMGGLNSEIVDTTRNVLLESAYFNPVSIRRTSKTLGLSTDASYRFERGVDPVGALRAAERAARMMAEIGGGRLVDGAIDEHPIKSEQKQIFLNVPRTNRVLDTDIGRDRMKSLLESIEFTAETTGDDALAVTPPSFRVDVSRPEDLTEEVARLYGYNNIPTTFPAMPAEARRPSERIVLRNKLKELMNGFGFSEVVNYSFTHGESCDRLRIPPDDPTGHSVPIRNPLTEDQAVMRTSLLPGLLETMQRNIAMQTRDLKLFEIGKIFLANETGELPDEPEYLAALWTGCRYESSWHGIKTPDCDFYDIKGAAEGLLAGLEIRDAVFGALPDSECHYMRPGYSAFFRVGGEYLGIVGELHPEVAKTYDLKQSAYIFEIGLSPLADVIPALKEAKPIPKFPAVARDLTLILDSAEESGKIVESVKYEEAMFLEDIFLLDMYDNISPGKKSVTFRIVYRSAERTLEDEEINHVHKAMADSIIGKFNAALPG